MKKLLSALFLLALCSSLAGANVPDPTKCTVGPLLGDPLTTGQVAFLSPGAIAGTTITITVRNASNVVIPNLYVEVIFNAAVKVCSNAVHTGTTNSLGVCVLTLKGGGCLSNIGTACVIKAGGLPIKTLLYVRSPDNEGHTASNPSGAVNTQDLGSFAQEYVAAVAQQCHDYDLANLCNTQDLGIFGGGYASGTTCTLLP
jgi:hypothetical protein